MPTLSLNLDVLYEFKETREILHTNVSYRWIAGAFNADVFKRNIHYKLGLTGATLLGGPVGDTWPEPVIINCGEIICKTDDGKVIAWKDRSAEMSTMCDIIAVICESEIEDIKAYWDFKNRLAQSYLKAEQEEAEQLASQKMEEDEIEASQLDRTLDDLRAERLEREETSFMSIDDSF